MLLMQMPPCFCLLHSPSCGKEEGEGGDGGGRRERKEEEEEKNGKSEEEEEEDTLGILRNYIV